MIIVSRFRNYIFNFDNFTEIFVSNKDSSIRGNNTNGHGCEIDRYETREDALTALEIVSEKLGSYNIIFMPTDKEIRAHRAKIHDTKDRSDNGKKTVRRGGS